MLDRAALLEKIDEYAKAISDAEASERRNKNFERDNRARLAILTRSRLTI
jgi:hypothetical protein